MKRRPQGFTLAELAVVLAIVGLLIGGTIMSFSARLEQHNFEETQRRLNAASEALLAYAIVNRRLPCPALPNATGDEDPATPSCTSWYGGFLPARTIGFPQIDASGYGLDVWGNRVRYALANLVTGCTGTSTTPHFTSQANLKANGVSCRPNDLDICLDAACTARAVSVETVGFIVYSTGKNGALTANHGPDELENTDGDARFVSRTPSSADSAAGAYDDVVHFVPAGVVYARLIAAGVLP